jgi:glycosyltransferase involved in cell wall biosynthesis
VTNALDPPPDEGTKKFAHELASQLHARGAVVSGVHKGSSFLARKLLLHRAAIARIRREGIRVVIYVPTQSVTRGSLIRAAVFRRLTTAKIILVALQPRQLAMWGYRWLAPDLLVTPSPHLLYQARRAGFRAEIIDVGVDTDRFVPATQEVRQELRRKYGLPADGAVVLHVGHARGLRGIAWLARLDREISRVVVVGRSLGIDPHVVRDLRSAGVRVIDTYLSKVEEIYQAADVYVFPVQDDGSAIATPMSVLEAMACNLPVITTRFGALPRLFPNEGSGLVYINNEPELRSAVDEVLADGRPAVETRQLVLSFDWAAIADAMIRRAADVCLAS